MLTCIVGFTKSNTTTQSWQWSRIRIGAWLHNDAYFVYIHNEIKNKIIDNVIGVTNIETENWSIFRFVRKNV